jgi:hypothetical protein
MFRDRSCAGLSGRIGKYRQRGLLGDIVKVWLTSSTASEAETFFVYLILIASHLRQTGIKGLPVFQTGSATVKSHWGLSGENS